MELREKVDPVRDRGARPRGAWTALAADLGQAGHEGAAAAALRRAIALSPADADPRLALASLVARTGDPAEAVELFHDVLALSPTNADARAGLAQALIGLGRVDEAADEIERALALDDRNITARLGNARLRLLMGQFSTAWEELEWRWQVPGQNRPEGLGRPWDGSPLDGATILLWAEQRLDDTIQMARYVPKVAAMGGRVVLSVPEPLVTLMKGLDGVRHVVAAGRRLPVPVEFNASLMDLPRLFGTALETIPAPPSYLSAPADRPIVAAPPGALLKVGLAWANGRPGWSVPLTAMMDLLAMPGIAWFGLQAGPRAMDVFKLAHPCLITDLSSTIGDFAAMAARIAELDLVVTVDGAIAHIAGALGKPALVLLPHAPDWRWMLHRADSPWYPTLTLLRQSRFGDWSDVLEDAARHIRALADERRDLRSAETRTHAGAKAAMRAFLAGHLAQGDAFIDIGAGTGTFALDAASHPSGDVRVLAVEAKRAEAEMLADTIAISGLDDIVEILTAPVAGRSAPVVVAKVPRHGRTVFPLPDWVPGLSESVAVDTLLGDRPDLAARRLVVRIGTRTSEAEVLDGLWEQVATQHAAVIVFEHREGAQAAEILGQAGYDLYCFPGEIAGGPARRFAGQAGAVLALASGVAPLECYGDLSDPASPAARALAEAEAARLSAEGTAKLLAGERDEAGRLLARALARDPANRQANANMGVLLRHSGRAAAAAACWKRALAAGFQAGNAINLANTLRTMGRIGEAAAIVENILAESPDNADALYAMAMIERQRDRSDRCLALLERCAARSPDTVPPYEMAVSLMKAGSLARGLADLAHRPLKDLPPLPESTMEWNGERLNARSILVRDEGDSIDTILLSRYIHEVARQGGLVTVECLPEVARLMTTLPGVEAVVPRGAPLPPTDLVVALPDVPRLIGTTSRSAPPRTIPYLGLADDMAPRIFPQDGRLNVGIVWAGRPRDPFLPLTALMPLAADPRLRLYSLQRGDRAKDLEAHGAQAFFEDLAPECDDLADIASAVAGLDLVIGVDSVEAHVAAAMGRPTWVMLDHGSGWHWVDGRDDSVWYPTMRVFRRDTETGWPGAVSRVMRALDAMKAAKA